MSYVALYRKFRPKDFDEVKGQDSIVTTLRNQIKLDRIGHAYLFCGTRGTGKTSVAKILAKAVNCEAPVDGNPCGTCAMCQKIDRQASVNVVEIDAASNNGVANIRDIVDEVQYSPAEGRFRVYIIDEVHMLSTGAFNALLKTLEEPPEYVIFILATTEAHKIPITILSRCQRYDFRRITVQTIQSRMQELVTKEGADVEERALHYIAKTADGSMRDALSLLDQCIAFYFGKTLTYDRALEVLGAVDTGVYSQMFRCITEYDGAGCLAIVDEMMVNGRDLTQFINEFIWYLRNLLLLGSNDHSSELVDASEEQLASMQEESMLLPADALIRMIRILSELSNQLRYATQKRVLIEIALIKLCRPQMDRTQDMTTILQRLEQVEKKLEQGITVQTAVNGSQDQNGQNGAGHRDATGTQADPTMGKPVGALPKALPEDVREVIEKWEQLTAKCSPVERLSLQHAKKLLGEDGALVLQFTDPMDERIFSDQDKKRLEELQTVIQNELQKKVTLRLQTVSEEEDRQVEDISRLINFEGIEWES